MERTTNELAELADLGSGRLLRGFASLCVLAARFAAEALAAFTHALLAVLLLAVVARHLLLRWSIHSFSFQLLVSSSQVLMQHVHLLDLFEISFHECPRCRPSYGGYRYRRLRIRE